MKSIWKESVPIKEFNQLNGDIKTDVLIIGGGITGILCAYLLKQKGIDYALVEADKIGMGITQNTTAKITVQHGLIYNDLVYKGSKEKAKQYLQANLAALKLYKKISSEIPCDFEEKDSFVYTLSDRKKIEDELNALSFLGYNAEFKQDLPLPFKVSGAVKFKNQAQFNPLKFISGICQDLHIYEQTFVNKVIGNTAFTKNGNIKANRIIIATHFPFINIKGMYSIKIYQHRSYVIALSSAADVNGMYVDERLNGMSFRNYKDLLLVGGGDHRTGKKGGNFLYLREFIQKAYPGSKEQYLWATQDCMSLDGIPYIGAYAFNSSNLLVATGYNKWGMTSSMVAAIILSDMIVHGKSVYGDVFSPQRNILKPQLLINVAESAVNLITPTKKRCTHLGCALKWNKVERSWDCPCHGSRFCEKGSVINNPAMKKLRISK